VVKRRFASDVRLMVAQDMHAFLSADVYFKPGTRKYRDSFLRTRGICCIVWRCRVSFQCPPSDDSMRSKWEEPSITLRGTGVLNLPALFAVDGSGGTGKITLLLLGAHDRPVRGKIHYILFLALGKKKMRPKQTSSPTLLILWTPPVVALLPQRYAHFPLESIKCRK
jgi:hypothetical protein